jgi:hypothetical protein
MSKKGNKNIRKQFPIKSEKGKEKKINTLNFFLKVCSEIDNSGLTL